MIVSSADTWHRLISAPLASRLIYRSSSGDEWLLSRWDDGEVHVVHAPNASSGGDRRQITLAGFLAGPRNAEVSAFLRLVGTLVDSAQAGEETS